MKAFLPTRLAAAAILAAATAVLPAPAAGTLSAPRPPQELQELAAVEQFLDLSDAELDQLLEVIARIRAMSPGERIALRREIVAYRQLPAPQREQMRSGWDRAHPGMGMGGGWGQMPAEIRDGWREMMRNATPEQHARIQAKLLSLSPKERSAYRRELVEEYLKTRAPAK